ncbi:MAG: Rpn family recombination-promoting nuclease/putative transposase, partial [Veillonellaceae bacterium]|nr:Rpn family recombination-promoting nuclease/putative transposase [Veillonellaceae bacterium]
MHKKDIWEKKLLDYTDVFADIGNVLLFGGESIIKEDALIDALPRSVYKMAGETHEQERDVAKFWQNSQLRFSLLGLENQSAADEDMPLRVISYDGAAYRQEINDDQKDQPKKRYPVVTLVLYFGYEQRWTKATHPKDCFDIPAKLKPYVNDYPIHVIEVAWLPDETIAKFKSDFRLVADMFSQLRKNKTYTPPPDELQHVQETMELLSAVTGDDRFKENAMHIPKGERKTMRLAFLDKLEAESEARG